MPEEPIENACDGEIGILCHWIDAVESQVFQLFIHLTKYLLSTCLVPDVMLGAGDIHSLHVWHFLPNLTSNTEHNKDS